MYLKLLLNVRHILEKINMSMQHSFEVFSEKKQKQRRVELKSVGNIAVKTVSVESPNKFSLGELCMTQYSLKYCSKSYRPSDRMELQKSISNITCKNSIQISQSSVLLPLIDVDLACFKFVFVDTQADRRIN